MYVCIFLKTNRLFLFFGENESGRKSKRESLKHSSKGGDGFPFYDVIRPVKPILNVGRYAKVWFYT